jgi:hypothetical protein
LLKTWQGHWMQTIWCLLWTGSASWWFPNYEGEWKRQKDLSIPVCGSI